MATPAGFTLGALAEALRAALDGDPARVVTGVAPLDRAGPEHVSFVTHARYRAAALASRAGAFVVGEGLTGLPGPTLRVAAPQLALITLLRLFHPEVEPPPGIHPSAVVADEARVDASATVGPLAVVEARAVVGPRARIHALVYVGAGVEVGEASVLYPGVVVREGVRLGRRVIVHPGAVLGGDGFGFAFDGREHRKIPQVGGVLVEDDVEIGANTTIDRATLGDTVVRRGTKIDNLVQIGHNVEVGPHCVVVAQVGIGGSCRLGGGVVLGGQVGLVDHVTLGEGAMVAAQSGVTHDVPPHARVLGSPARPMARAKRVLAAAEHLPELVRRLREAERRIARLEGQLGIGGPEGAGRGRDRDREDDDR